MSPKLTLRALDTPVLAYRYTRGIQTPQPLIT
jgi:hypothetical protein